MFQLILFFHLATSVAIQDCKGLQQMSESLAGQFTLSQNIDCRGIDFQPVGSLSAPFSGSFDGAGFAITGLNIFQPQFSYVGLFGYVMGGSIRNVQLTAKVNGAGFVGTLVGLANLTSITDVIASGNVISGRYCGGLIGAMIQGKLVNCTASSTVVSNGGIAGGLIGSVTSATVLRGAAFGEVSASCSSSDYIGAGGLIGSINASSSALAVVAESSASGSVTAACVLAAGLIGAADSQTTIQNCFSNSSNITNNGYSSTRFPVGLVAYGNPFVVYSYAVGSASCSVQTCCCSRGGLMGCPGSTAPMTTFSFYNSDNTIDACQAPGNVTTEQMKQQATFSNWDFKETWGIREGNSYPFLLLL